MKPPSFVTSHVFLLANREMSRYPSYMNQIQIIGSIMAATGKTVADVAKDHGYTKFPFYRVIKGESKNKVIRQLISKLISKPIDEIWPESAKKEGNK